MEQTLNSTPKWIWIVNLAIALLSSIVSMLLNAYNVAFFGLIGLFVINIIILILKFVKKYGLDATYPFIFTILMYLSIPFIELIIYKDNYSGISTGVLIYTLLIYSIYTGSKLFKKNE